MGIGIKSLFKDLGLEVKIQVNTVSSAASIIPSRRGAGRARHVEVRELWVQERVRRAELSIVKVRGEEIVAGALTKNVDRHKNGAIRCGFVLRDGWHELCPHFGDV